MMDNKMTGKVSALKALRTVFIERLLSAVTHTGWRTSPMRESFGIEVFITVCECGYNRQQLVVVVAKVAAVVKHKYQPHFTTICTAASRPEPSHITAPLIAPLHS